MHSGHAKNKGTKFFPVSRFRCNSSDIACTHFAYGRVDRPAKMSVPIRPTSMKMKRTNALKSKNFTKY